MSSTQLPRQEGQSLWLKNPIGEFLFFIFPGLLSIPLTFLFLYLGPRWVEPVALVYFVFFALPHNFMTISTLVGPSNQIHMNMRPVYLTILGTGLVATLIASFQGTKLQVVLVSFVVWYVNWHTYRQHQALVNMYTFAQDARFPENDVKSDLKWLNRFFMLIGPLSTLWAFTSTNLSVSFSQGEIVPLMYPHVSFEFLEFYGLVAGVLLILALYDSVFRRLKRGKRLPGPQVAIVLSAMLSYLFPLFFLPWSQYYYLIVIAGLHHSVQYIGFVWMYERSRVSKLENPLFFQRLVLQRRWLIYGAFAISFGAILQCFYAYGFEPIALGLTNFILLSHYIAEGFIWKREYNRFIPTFLRSLA